MTTEPATPRPLLTSKDKVATLVVDSGPLIKGHQLAHLSSSFVTIPEVLAELRDKQTREAVAALPFQLQTRVPSEEAIAAIVAFSKKTGDYAALSTTDLKVLALTWMLEKETSGIAHLRTEPMRPTEAAFQDAEEADDHEPEQEQTQAGDELDDAKDAQQDATQAQDELQSNEPQQQPGDEQGRDAPQSVSASQAAAEEMDDDEGWITPKNVAMHKARDLYGVSATKGKKKNKTPNVACMTTDFAMQNVLLQMGLSVLSVDGVVIRRIKNWVLRCHACYKVTPDMSKRFCPSCGNSTLMRTSVGVDADGNVTYYLKRNFQYNLRGTKYSIPASKGGWQSGDLVLREDQKEFQRALKEKQRRDKQLLNATDVLDADSLLFGSSGSLLSKTGQPIIGHGRRNVNESRSGRRRK
ncbi:Nin one binding Zn-ribbon like-domain-containing protein [Entophlyctis helioformis]|nr:Nin one binding Zn-ribbon like-domain-containing protein [Entophlyctis helioformis]